MTSRETLMDMGFDAKLVDKALQHSEELGAAIDWIENHPEAENDSEEPGPAPAIPPEDPAASTDCTKSVEERLAEMQAKAAERKKEEAKKDAIERRRNEEILRKNQQDTRDAKRELEIKQAQKAAAQRKKDALEDRLYKEKLRKQIEQDKQERLARQGKLSSPSPASVPTPSPPAAASAPRPPPTGNVRLRASYQGNTVTKSYPPDFTVAQLGEDLRGDFGLPRLLLTTTYPPSSVSPEGDARTLREAGFANASVVVKDA